MIPPEVAVSRRPQRRRALRDGRTDDEVSDEWAPDYVAFVSCPPCSTSDRGGQGCAAADIDESGTWQCFAGRASRCRSRPDDGRFSYRIQPPDGHRPVSCLGQREPPSPGGGAAAAGRQMLGRSGRVQTGAPWRGTAVQKRRRRKAAVRWCPAPGVWVPRWWWCC